MIKAKIQLDVTEIANEMVSRFDAGVINSDNLNSYLGGEDKDNLSNIMYDAVKTLLNELNEELG